MTRWYFLVVPAHGTPRVTHRRPALKPDEIAFRLRVNVPDGWGRVNGDVDVTLPDPPVVAAEETHL